MPPATQAHPETLYAPGHWRAPYCQPPELLQIQRVPIRREGGWWVVADEYGAAMVDAETFRAWFGRTSPGEIGREARLVATELGQIGTRSDRQLAEVTPTQSVRVKGLPGWNGSGYYPMPMAGWLWAGEQWRLGRRWVGLEVAR